MMNYGIFTQIYVLQGFNSKEIKTSKKSRKKKWLRQEMQLRGDIITALSRQNPKATCRSLSQHRQSRVQDDSRKIIATFHNSVVT